MKRWYVVSVFSGKENDIKGNILKKIDDSSLKKFFGRVLVPIEHFIEMKHGKKEQGQRCFFPGYILIEMFMMYKTWLTIKDIPGIIDFLGCSLGNPIPIKDSEVNFILNKIEESSFKPKPKKTFQIGEMIRVVSGPFSDFTGKVEEINYSKNKLCVGVLIFGRSTPVDLNFNQVEKI